MSLRLFSHNTKMAKRGRYNGTSYFMIESRTLVTVIHTLRKYLYFGLSSDIQFVVPKRGKFLARNPGPM